MSFFRFAPALFLHCSAPMVYQHPSPAMVSVPIYLWKGFILAEDCGQGQYHPDYQLDLGHGVIFLELLAPPAE